MKFKLRSVWVQMHLWLGLTLGVLGVFIGLTGSVLVFGSQLDRWLNPQRYAVSGGESSLPGLPLAAYLEYASRALQGRARPTGVRLPDTAGAPAVVLALENGGAGALYRVYLDPPSGRVLEVAASGGPVSMLHNFHENLTLRDFGGRNAVGLAGFAMLISALSGIYLWWPVGGHWRLALTGRRRGVTASRNVHYLFGFYGSLILAMLCFTGIFIAYPNAGRIVVGWFSPVSTAQNADPAPKEPPPGARPATVSDAEQAAQALYPDAKISGIFLPQRKSGIYRVFLNDSAGSPITVFVDANSGAVMQRADPVAQTAGDKFLAMQRKLHSGSNLGIVGRIAICVTGLLPLLLAVTGTMMWLRGRNRG
jgi:uncharacterized iron-regulated membrane protein